MTCCCILSERSVIERIVWEMQSVPLDVNAMENVLDCGAKIRECCDCGCGYDCGYYGCEYGHDYGYVNDNAHLIVLLSHVCKTSHPEIKVALEKELCNSRHTLNNKNFYMLTVSLSFFPWHTAPRYRRPVVTPASLSVYTYN